MQTYLVGGAVRDELLGLPIGERDWVVVGATPKEMGAQGFKPVGRHFPVFLHPDTKEEYALARTERKTGPGYHGFEFYTGLDVTLEDDLRRRDLTVNAIARDDKGTLIDPYGGERDIRDRVLRHVSSAFVEDPVRVLRVARFAARFAPLGFRVADATILMMREMVDNGETRALVAERAWKEFETALGEPAPSRFFMVLDDIGVFASLAAAVPGLGDLLQSPDAVNAVGRALDGCAGSSPLTVFAALALQSAVHGMALEPACKRLRAPSVYAKLAKAASFSWQRLNQAQHLHAEVLLDIFERSDAFRNAARLTALLDAWPSCDFPLAGDKQQYLARMRAQFKAACKVDLKRVVEAADGDVGAAVHQARLEAVSKKQQGE